MPPNRPMGADIPELSDAAQEFLTDWLVRHEYDEAMEFVSDESLTCLVDKPGIDVEKGLHGRPCRNSSKQSGKRLGEHSSLSTVISAVKCMGTEHSQAGSSVSREFDLVEVTDSIGESFLCRNRKERFQGGQKSEPVFGTYYGTLFRFRIRTADKGTLALLWKKESGQWRIQSYDVIAQ